MEIVVRAAIVFAFLWFVTRTLGKEELAEMSAFELVLLVVIGDLVQQGVTQEDMSLTGAVLAGGTIALLVLGKSYAAFRWRAPRDLIEGVPAVIVREGELLPEVIRAERLAEEEVLEAAPQQGVASMEMVVVGVLEPDGRFSFIQRDGTRTTDDGRSEP